MTRFAEAARRLAGQAGLMFGWTPDVFWAATPAELGALVAAAAGEEGGAEPPEPALIARLMKEHPDG